MVVVVRSVAVPIVLSVVVVVVAVAANAAVDVGTFVVDVGTFVVDMRGSRYFKADCFPSLFSLQMESEKIRL